MVLDDVQRALRRLQDDLEDIQTESRKLELKTSDAMDRWQAAQHERDEDTQTGAQIDAEADDPSENEAAPWEGDDPGDEVREGEAGTARLLERLEKFRPKDWPSFEERLHGRR